VGGWSLEAAEIVVADEGLPITVLDGLDSLAGKSLITQRMQPDGEIRLGMLTIIREFGLERLAETGDETHVRDRHAAWVVRLVEQAAEYIEGAEQVNWLARLARDSDNIRAGLGWLRECRNAEPALRVAQALRLHWFTRGRIREGLEQIIAITDLPESESFPALRADALTAASFLAREMGDYPLAYDITRASLAISHQIHDRQRSADALVNLGFIALHRGQLDDARSILQRSLTTNREMNNDQGVADSLGFLALVDAQSGDLDAACRRLEQCITIWNRLGDLQGVAWANAQLGLVRLEQHDYAHAWDALMTSLSLSASLDFRGDIYMVFDGLARIALSFGCANLACSLAAAATSVREQSGITPAPADQKRIDRLSTDLRESFPAEEIRNVWSRRHDWTLEQIMQSVTASLAPLIDASSTTTPTVSQTISPA
jgi:non-specific serine/threonine protein kinase